MEIEQHLWGMTPEGEGIILYIMRNESGGEVRLSSYGAAVVALKLPDRDGHIDDVALGYKQFNSYFGDPVSCGKTLGRVAGRIAYGQMIVDGCEHRLEVNDGINHLNGGSRGFGNRLWEGRVETNRVVMSLWSEADELGYPGELNAEVIFDFDDSNTLEITYLARTTATTPVNLASNIYLNLSGEASGSVLDHELQLAATRAPELDDRRIPTGVFLDVTGSAQDFSEFRSFGSGINTTFNRINDFRGYDHPFLLTLWQPNILTEACTLRDPRSGRYVKISTSAPCINIETGNRLAGGCPETISGARYANHAGVSIVCGHAPDAINRVEFPSPLLSPEELYCNKTVYQFGTY